MEVMTIDSKAFQTLTEQLAEIARFVRMANEALQEKASENGLKPMLDNDGAARMLGVSKRTLQRMRSDNRIGYVMLGRQCRYSIQEIERMIAERTIARDDT